MSRLDQSKKTDKKYTLVYRGKVVINWDDIEMLRGAMHEFNQTKSTYIRYNETGMKEYQDGR